MFFYIGAPEVCNPIRQLGNNSNLLVMNYRHEVQQTLKMTVTVLADTAW